MLSKKSQLSIFFVLGVVLLVISVIVILSGKRPAVESTFFTESEFSETTHFIESCLAKAGEDATYYVMLQGGYFEPQNYLNLGQVRIAVHFDSGEINPPSIGIIKNELLRTIRMELIRCIESQPFGHLSISHESIEISVDILEESMIVTVSDGISLKSGLLRRTLPAIATTIPLNLRDLIDAGSIIVHSQTNEIPISLIAKLAAERGFVFEVIPIENSAIISLIRDQRDDKLIYSFGNIYEES